METQAVPATPVAIEVFADIVCPWCFVGNERLETTAAEAEEAARSGMGGVPFFVFDQRFAVSGAQQEEVMRAAIARALSTRPG